MLSRHKHMYWTCRLPTANLFLTFKQVIYFGEVCISHLFIRSLASSCPLSQGTYHPLNKLLLPVSELPFCCEWHTNLKLAIARVFLWEPKNSAHFRESSQNVQVTHRCTNRTFCHVSEFGAEEGWMSSVDYCLLPVAGNMGTLSSTTNLSFQATAMSIFLYLDTGELLLKNWKWG